MEKINLNRATEDELVKIIHVGKVRAKKIVQQRPYRDVHELSNISGLGKKRMDDILKQDLIVV